MPELHVVFVPLLIVRRIAVIAIPAEQQHITYFDFLQIFKQTDSQFKIIYCYSQRRIVTLTSSFILLYFNSQKKKLFVQHFSSFTD